MKILLFEKLGGYNKAKGYNLRNFKNLSFLMENTMKENQTNVHILKLLI